MADPGKTILLIGGGGYIGTGLIEQLLELGHRVKLIDRFFFTAINYDFFNSINPIHPVKQGSLWPTLV